MVNLGYDGLDGDSFATHIIEDTIRGATATMPLNEGGKDLTVTVRVNNSTSSVLAKAAIYRDSVLIAASVEQSIPANSDQTVVFTFTGSPTLDAGIQYHICCWSATVAGFIRIYHRAVTGENGIVKGKTYNSYPDPLGTLTSTIDDERLDIFCTYTGTGLKGGRGERGIRTSFPEDREDGKILSLVPEEVKIIKKDRVGLDA